MMTSRRLLLILWLAVVSSTNADSRRSSYHRGYFKTLRPIQQSNWVTKYGRIRGGGRGAQEKGAVPVPTVQSKVLTIPPPPPSLPPAANKSASLSTRVTAVNRTTRAWKRKQFWALVALRFGYILLTPISLVIWLFFLALSIVVHAFFILTFSLVGGQVRIMVNSLAKAGLAMVLASVCGILLPIFASFGLVISILQCGLELTEPLLRIKYQRQLRKIKHLHKLLTDPILVETLQGLLKGASAVSRATQRQVSSSTRKGLGVVQRALPSQDQLAKTSTELVEQLIQSSGTIQSVLEDFQEKAPKPVWRWTQQQYKQLKESGLLEEAAQRALAALKGELEAAAGFLPYLDAIEQVRQQQQKETEKAKEKQDKLNKKKRRQQRK